MLQRLLDKRADLKQWLLDARKQERAKDKHLIDFLIMPVQRIPRYSLLLRELHKATPATHPDYAVRGRPVIVRVSLCAVLTWRRRALNWRWTKWRACRHT